MQAMAKTLGKLVAACHGDDRPDCPILDDLALGEAGVEVAESRPRPGEALALRLSARP